MKIKDATFNTAVRLPNKKMVNFISEEHADLFYNAGESMLYISNKSTGIIKLVGMSNIQEMTAEVKAEKPKKGE